MTEVKKIAVLIDSDNTSHAKLNLIMEELSSLGKVVVKRAYGDFSSEYLKNWKDPLNKLAIQPRQQFAYTTGKNSTDSVMIIEAMDLLYSSKFDMFALVSSDSEFTSLATRLRESEIEVVGVGKTTTPIPFKNACDSFISIELLGLDNEKLNADVLKGGLEILKDDNAVSLLVPPINENIARYTNINNLWKIMHSAWSKCSDISGWSKLSEIEICIKNRTPEFDVKKYGLRELIEFFNLYPESYELFPVDSDVEVKYVKKTITKNKSPYIPILDLAIPEN